MVVLDEPGSLPEGAKVRIEWPTSMRPPTPAATTDRAEWHEFVSRTYGSCAGLGLERPPPGTWEEREALP